MIHSLKGVPKIPATAVLDGKRVVDLSKNDLLRLVNWQNGKILNMEKQIKDYEDVIAEMESEKTEDSQ